QAIPSQSIGTITARVMFPLFSRLQDDPARLRNGLQKAITSTVFLQFPMMIGLATVAKPLILVLLTEKWLPIVPYFQLLCVAGIWFPLQLLNLNALMAIGRSDLFFQLEIIKKVTIVLSIALTYRWGVMALVLGQVATSVIAYFINSYYTGRFIRYSTWEQLRHACPYFLAAVVMAAVVEIATIPGGNPLFELIYKIAIGATTYTALTIIFRFPATKVIGELVLNRMRSSSTSPQPL
ncbi:MAG: oligosaccharide flippase family protein, partial [Verrucomicrobiota bacterium]